MKSTSETLRRVRLEGAHRDAKRKVTLVLFEDELELLIGVVGFRNDVIRGENPDEAERGDKLTALLERARTR